MTFEFHDFSSIMDHFQVFQNCGNPEYTVQLMCILKMAHSSWVWTPFDKITHWTDCRVKNNSIIIFTTEPLRGHSGGKKYERVGKIISMLLGSLANVLCPPEKLCVQGNAKHFAGKREVSQGKECKSMAKFFLPSPFSSSPCSFRGSILYSFIWGHLLGLRMS